MAEERALHESKLAKMESEMKMVFQQKVNEKEAKLKQSEEELYARHREMKEALEKQRIELEEKKRRLESGRPLTPEKVSWLPLFFLSHDTFVRHGSDADPVDRADQEEGIPPHLKRRPSAFEPTCLFTLIRNDSPRDFFFPPSRIQTFVPLSLIPASIPHLFSPFVPVSNSLPLPLVFRSVAVLPSRVPFQFCTFFFAFCLETRDSPPRSLAPRQGVSVQLDRFKKRI